MTTPVRKEMTTTVRREWIEGDIGGRRVRIDLGDVEIEMSAVIGKANVGGRIIQINLGSIVNTVGGSFEWNKQYGGGQIIGVTRDFLECFYDPNPCSFDHHGNCQEHNFVLDPGEMCPNRELKRLLEL